MPASHSLTLTQAHRGPRAHELIEGLGEVGHNVVHADLNMHNSCVLQQT